MPEQLIFDWQQEADLKPEDFFVSEANANAAAMVQDPALWPEKKLVITGAQGAGKSHLARVFQIEQNAMLLNATSLPMQFDAQGPVIVEDMQDLSDAQEEAMFHLHNAQRAAGFALLMTAREAPSRWALKLPDLISRMQATTPVAITAPDDQLLRFLLTKLFSDRQVIPSPGVINYVATRVDRSYVAVAEVVAKLDHMAMVTKKPASIRMAAELLDN